MRSQSILKLIKCLAILFGVVQTELTCPPVVDTRGCNDDLCNSCTTDYDCFGNCCLCGWCYWDYLCPILTGVNVVSSLSSSATTTTSSAVASSTSFVKKGVSKGKTDQMFSSAGFKSLKDLMDAISLYDSDAKILIPGSTFDSIVEAYAN